MHQDVLTELTGVTGSSGTEKGKRGVSKSACKSCEALLNQPGFMNMELVLRSGARSSRLAALGHEAPDNLQPGTIKALV